ncbi:helix-turn-helix domain-containing protein [Acetobacterium tundrae]|uniref:helix-turn-helix domain-containing protein n=1 Tax=Acetobacterium tundrae TaxID=132932 RepID=UPI00164AB93B|nr:helix-turn-helix transcriptional regulator [Acetobacterium tundrae]
MKSKLRIRREEKKVTLREVASILDVDTVTYFYYETGKRNVPNEIVDKLMKYFEINEKEKKEFFLPNNFSVCKTAV